MTFKMKGRFDLVLLFFILILAHFEYSPSEGYSKLSDFESGVLKFAQNPEGGKCECNATKCGCCESFGVAVLSIKSVCVDVQYLVKDVGVLLTVTVNDHILLKQEISVKNPEPLCINIPWLKVLAKACIKLDNFKVGKYGISGCVKFVVNVAVFDVVNINLGCFNIPFAEDGIPKYAPTPLELSKDFYGGKNIA